jgi:hypothetical protein
MLEVAASVQRRRLGPLPLSSWPFAGSERDAEERCSLLELTEREMLSPHVLEPVAVVFQPLKQQEPFRGSRDLVRPPVLAVRPVQALKLAASFDEEPAKEIEHGLLRHAVQRQQEPKTSHIGRLRIRPTELSKLTVETLRERIERRGSHWRGQSSVPHKVASDSSNSREISSDGQASRSLSGSLPSSWKISSASGWNSKGLARSSSR